MSVLDAFGARVEDPKYWSYQKFAHNFKGLPETRAVYTQGLHRMKRNGNASQRARAAELLQSQVYRTRHINSPGQRGTKSINKDYGSYHAEATSSYSNSKVAGRPLRSFEWSDTYIGGPCLYNICGPSSGQLLEVKDMPQPTPSNILRINNSQVTSDINQGCQSSTTKRKFEHQPEEAAKNTGKAIKLDESVVAARAWTLKANGIMLQNFPATLGARFPLLSNTVEAEEPTAMPQNHIIQCLRDIPAEFVFEAISLLGPGGTIAVFNHLNIKAPVDEQAYRLLHFLWRRYAHKFCHK
ncbi:hypothetical protein DFS34DRAFT_588632 [Phlyctochytrium arcticum]|nr:hypothetical protein DFS34DRAFT_588632 [Phlyctochytrium arcticum]